MITIECNNTIHIVTHCPFWQAGRCNHPLREAMTRDLYCDYVHDVGQSVIEPMECPLFNAPLTVKLEKR